MGEALLELATGGWGFIKNGFSFVGKFLASLNAQGVVGLIIAALLTFGLLHEIGVATHWSKQSNRWETLYNNEVSAERKAEAQAQSLKAQIDAQSSTISEKNRELNDAQNARIDADANALRLRGPGKAACDHPQLSTPSGGSQQTPSTVQNAGPQVPSGDWAAVPWSWLVSVVQEHDQLLTEDQTWRNNDAQQRKAWPEMSKRP